MGIVAVPESLRGVLGSQDLASLNENDLRKLVGLRESDELEVKSEHYGNGDSARREFAADVSSLANARGGLLILGASESGEEITALQPLDLVGEELRITQSLASLIAPFLDVQICLIPSSADSSKGYILIGVPPSPAAPHAVIKGTDLRFFTRNGPSKRPMSESEVADRYRRRFTNATSRLERLQAVHEGLTDLLHTDEDLVWLILSGMPEIPGHVQSSRAALDAIRSWLQEADTLAPYGPDLNFLRYGAAPGFGRFVAGQGQSFEDQSKPPRNIAEFHHDGATALALVVGHNWQHQSPFDEQVDALSVGDEGLSFAVLAGLALVGAHAKRVGSAGSVDVTASIYSGRTVDLRHTRHYGIPQPLGVRRLAAFERRTHTLSLTDLSTPSRGLVAAGHLVVSDLVAGFGLPESLQLGIDGTLQWNSINTSYRPYVERWALQFDIPISGRDL